MTVYKKDLQREQAAHLATQKKVEKLKKVVASQKEEIARLTKPEEVVTRYIKVVDLSLVSKEELEKALKDSI